MTEEERIQKIARLARRRQRDGDVEFDEITENEISEGDDNGAYVRAWVWISFAGTDLDKEADDDEEEEEEEENP